MANRRIVPNFFLAGAPKCGTTSLSKYLLGHPNVFMCYPKEPKFFADDLFHIHAFGSFDDYLALFRKCGDQHLAVGEASASYLYSRNAMKQIRAFNGDARIILMFRNPVDFLQSFHAQLLFAFNEDREDFVEAWNLQDDRRNGHHVPETCIAPEFLQYRTAAKFGEQLERLLTIFPREQIKCIVFDDFIADPQAVYLDVLAFLGVPDDGRTAFPRYNEAKTHRSRRLGAFMMHAPPLLRSPWNVLKKICGPGISRLSEGVIRANATPRRPRALPPDFQMRLRREFSADVEKLSRLIGRDLSFWTDAHEGSDP